LYNEIQKAREVDDHQLLAALNIPGIGANIAKLILEKYSLQELPEVSEDALADIAGIGPERARAVRQVLQEKRDEFEELLGAVTVRSRQNSSAAALPGICFTGKMPEKRSFYENLARSRGYEPADSVTSAVTLLVAADVNENSSKLKKARKMAVTIVSLDEFLAMPPVKNTVESTPSAGQEFSDLPLFGSGE